MGDEINIHYPAYFTRPWWWDLAGLRELDRALEVQYGAAMRALPPPAAGSP